MGNLSRVQRRGDEEWAEQAGGGGAGGNSGQARSTALRSALTSTRARRCTPRWSLAALGAQTGILCTVGAARRPADRGRPPHPLCATCWSWDTCETAGGASKNKACAVLRSAWRASSFPARLAPPGMCNSLLHCHPTPASPWRSAKPCLDDQGLSSGLSQTAPSLLQQACSDQRDTSPCSSREGAVPRTCCQRLQEGLPG